MILVGTNPMAKAKKSEPKNVLFGASKPIGLAMRCSAEFKDWLERYARKNRINVASAVERALAIAAEVDKFEPPPAR